MVLALQWVLIFPLQLCMLGALDALQLLEKGVSITNPGVLNDYNGDWRSKNGLALSAAHMIGVDGFWVFGGNFRTLQPPYITAVYANPSVFNGNSGYYHIQDPLNPSSYVMTGTLNPHAPTNSFVVDFSFTLQVPVPSTVRVGIMIDNLDNTIYNPYGIALVQTNGDLVSGPTVFTTDAQFNNRNPDWIFFDLSGFSAGSSFSVKALGGSQNLGCIGAISFDSACSSNCAICTSSSSCFQCSSGFLYQGACVSACPNGYYGASNMCSACSSNCAICTSSSSCSQCSSGFLYQGACVSTCPNGYYGASNICSACSSNCGICTSASSCSQCSSGFLYQDSCVSTCPNGYYGASNMCSACSSNCAICTSSSSCSQCSSGFLYQGSCVSICPNGYYGASNLCSACSSNCAICTSSSSCSQCSSGFLYQGACVSTCPNGYYGASNMCSACSSNCAICTSSSSCSQCSSGFLYQGSCVSTCPNGYYGASNMCSACSSNCATCTSSSSCSQCSSGFLYQGACVSTCPNGYYGASNMCSACSGNCAICTSSSSCSQCSSGLLYQGACVSTCTNDDYGASNTCSDNLIAAAIATSNGDNANASVPPTAITRGAVGGVSAMVVIVGVLVWGQKKKNGDHPKQQKNEDTKDTNPSFTEKMPDTDQAPTDDCALQNLFRVAGPQTAAYNQSVRQGVQTLPQGKQYHCFASHKKQDRDSEQLAMNICDALKSQGMTTFFDVDNLRGQEITDTVLSKAIKETCVMIVILDDKILDSKWCIFEWQCAYQNNVPIVAVFDIDKYNVGERQRIISRVNNEGFEYVTVMRIVQYTSTYRADAINELASIITNQVSKIQESSSA